MTVTALVNDAIRHIQGLVLRFGGLGFAKRFLHLNVLIAVLFLVLILQLLYTGGFSSSADTGYLVLLKSETVSSAYEGLIKKTTLADFKKLPLEEKCNAYFDQLQQMNPEWKLDNFDTADYDDNYVDFDQFLEFKRKAEPNLDFTEKVIEDLQKEFAEKSFFSIKVDNRITDGIATLRIFGKCFLEGHQSGSKFNSLPSVFAGKKGEQTAFECSDIEARVFPWLIRTLPTYTRWDGITAKGIPDFTNGRKGSDTRTQRETKSNCFLEKLRESINGRGFVISASDGQVGELKKLAGVLRALDNKLPIQIVHKGDLSRESQQTLIDAFRKEITPDMIPSSYGEVGRSADLKFPPQELWFVNVAYCVKENFKPFFHRYANKLLAYMFNSFDDMILLDSDTVPFVDLETILTFPGYVEDGAYFFQDRNLEGGNTENQVAYFRRMLPSKMDNVLFDIPLATDFTLNNKFMVGKRYHYMESGVVAIRRSTHFTGMLVSLQLNFWSVTYTKVLGDKELFWLGQSIAGNEKYTFNALDAASIGELTKSENKRFGKSDSEELCSNHPGHISGYDNSTLMWMNSGYTYCKNTGSAGGDAGKPLYNGLDEAQIRHIYESKTLIRAAIVPPPQEIDGKNSRGNPDRGWSDEHKYCWGYTWCAVSYIGLGSTPEEHGLLVKFNNEEINWFDFLGDVWMDEFLKRDSP
jgi:alpha 1,3-mannosyltransferase